MKPLLMGKAQEFDLLAPEIRAMVENEGIYLCGDKEHPEATVPVASLDGQLYSMKLDEKLNPEKFLPTVTVAGPFYKDQRHLQ